MQFNADSSGNITEEGGQLALMGTTGLREAGLGGQLALGSAVQGDIWP